MEEQMKIVIVGHVDHGKSTLIGRLLFDTGSIPPEKIAELKKVCEELGKDIEFAYVMDNLEEERQQNVTIDIAHTFFKTKKRDYVIIDAPGHVEFVKNMITGASQAEAAILIVDVEEGVQEQTKRHAYILSLLGITQTIVALNKMDLIGYDKGRQEEVKQDLIKFLDSIKITPSYIVPISAKEGDNIAKKSDNMPWYEGLTLLEALDKFRIAEPQTEKPARFPIQDVYKIDNKRVLVGRIEAGRIKEGQRILFLPSNKETTVKSIEAWNSKKDSAEAGESTGITITEPLFIERGEVACEKGNLPKSSTVLHANLFWMDKQPFKINERLILKCTTQETSCRIESIAKRVNSSTLETIGENASELCQNEVGQVMIKTDKPVVFEDFNNIEELGRFVLERDMNICAGGIITNVN